MDIRVVQGDAAAFRGDALVVGLFEGARVGAPLRRPVRTAAAGDLEGATAAADAALDGAIRRLVQSGEATGKWGEQTLIHTLGRLPAGRILVAGLGRPEEFTLDRLRVASAETARYLRRIGARRFGSVLHLARMGEFNRAQAAQALVEGALLGLYRFTRYKGSGEEERAIQTLAILESDPHTLRVLGEAVRRGRIAAEATNAARDLVNEPANALTPTELGRRAAAMARRAGVRCRVLGPPELRRLRAGALLGVARGSQEPPRLILLEYRGGRPTGPHLGLVGKGITFDSGGISLKPAENMETMKGDMAGAAAVITSLCAIARLKLPVRVTGVVPATENLPSGTALKPGDVLRAMNGTTIEVINTDAEGRLILADALHYARTRGVTHLVDVATLTGACVVALGTITSGAFASDQGLLDALLRAAKTTGEKLWPMPTDPEYDELLKSDIAAVKNTGGRKGGAITAAKFLQRFVGETPWVHLDIAGTSETDKEKGYQPKGATGVMVRTFVALAQELLSP